MTSNAPDGRDISDGRLRKRLATRCVADRVKIWKTAIGQFVRFEMTICERKLRRTVDAAGHRRRNAPTFLSDRVPASHILIMPHSIDAVCNQVVTAIISICRGALVIDRKSGVWETRLSVSV